MVRFRDLFLSFVKGALLGFSSLVPGLSLGSILVSFGMYEYVIEILNNLKKDKRKLLLIFIPLLIGTLLGFFGGAHLVSYFLTHYKVQTIFLFIGIMVGGFSLLIKNNKLKFSIKKSPMFVILILFMIGIYLVLTSYNITASDSMYNNFFLGLLTGSTFLIPGASESSFLLFFKKYDYLAKILKTFTFNNMFILLLFFIGAILGILIISRVINNFLKNYENKTYFVIGAFLLASIVIAILEIDAFKVSFASIFTTLLAFLWGYLLSKNLEKE